MLDFELLWYQFSREVLLRANSSREAQQNKTIIWWPTTRSNKTVTMGEEDLTDVEVSYFDALDALYFEELAKRDNVQDEGGANNRLHQRGGRKTSLRQIKGHVDARQKKLRESIRRRRKKMLQIMSNPKTIMLRDKVSFVLGVLLIMVIEFVLLVHPAKMGLLYTSLLLPLMTARYIICKSSCPFLMHDESRAYNSHTSFAATCTYYQIGLTCTTTSCMTFVTLPK